MSSTLKWQKSTFSGANSSTDCVEVAAASGTAIHLRESDTPTTLLTTAPVALGALIAKIKTGGLPVPVNR